MSGNYSCTPSYTTDSVDLADLFMSKDDFRKINFHFFESHDVRHEI